MSKKEFSYCQNVETLSWARATVNLPKTEINGSKQRKSVCYEQLNFEFGRLLEVLIKQFLILHDTQKMKIWKY